MMLFLEASTKEASGEEGGEEAVIKSSWFRLSRMSRIEKVHIMMFGLMQETVYERGRIRELDVDPWI